MKLYKIFAGLLIGVFLFGLATVVSADDPPKSGNQLPQPTSTPSPAKGRFDPVPIQAGEEVLDPATASVTRMELAEDDKSLAPAMPPAEASSSIKGNGDPFAPGPTLLVEYDGGTLRTIPNSANIANDLSIGSLGQSDRADQQIGTASSTQIASLNFESAFPPADPLLTRFDDDGTLNGEYLWDDVPCFPVESSGNWSAWPADNGADGFNLGTTDCDTAAYPNNAGSWLVYGPFSLADAQSASLDFFFRIVSESCNPITACDYLFWGASINGTSFFGQRVTGTHTSGPFNNGYNFASFDLTDVPTLGDLSGEAQVWIAFLFRSDVSVTAQGPFIDFISLRSNTDARVTLTDENFDVADFPNVDWDAFDNDGPANGEYYWDDVGVIQGPNCPPRSGSWSMWPADNGANALNSCQGDSYANDMESWLVHGPFNLTGASEAWADFYFRNVSETGFDTIAWLASKNGFFFSGFGTSGTYTAGPHNNGYNLSRLDLSNAGSLGDLRGEPQVWLAFIFNSDTSVTAQGPFIDDVKVVVERPGLGSGTSQVYLPLVIKTEIQPAKVFVTNFTGGTLTYQIFGTSAGNIFCTVPNNAQDFFCGPAFDPGSLDWRADAVCGSKTGTKFFSSGDNFPAPFSCG